MESNFVGNALCSLNQSIRKSPLKVPSCSYHRSAIDSLGMQTIRAKKQKLSEPQENPKFLEINPGKTHTGQNFFHDRSMALVKSGHKNKLKVPGTMEMPNFCKVFIVVDPLVNQRLYYDESGNQFRPKTPGAKKRVSSGKIGKMPQKQNFIYRNNPADPVTVKEEILQFLNEEINIKDEPFH